MAKVINRLITTGTSLQFYILVYVLIASIPNECTKSNGQQKVKAKVSISDVTITSPKERQDMNIFEKFIEIWYFILLLFKKVFIFVFNIFRSLLGLKKYVDPFDPWSRKDLEKIVSEETKNAELLRKDIPDMQKCPELLWERVAKKNLKHSMTDLWINDLFIEAGKTGYVEFRNNSYKSYIKQLIVPGKLKSCLNFICQSGFSYMGCVCFVAAMNHYYYNGLIKILERGGPNKDVFAVQLLSSFGEYFQEEIDELIACGFNASPQFKANFAVKLNSLLLQVIETLGKMATEVRPREENS